MPPRHIFQVDTGRNWVDYSHEINSTISAAYNRRLKSVGISLPAGPHTIHFDTMTQVAKYGTKRALKVRIATGARPPARPHSHVDKARKPEREVRIERKRSPTRTTVIERRSQREYTTSRSQQEIRSQREYTSARSKQDFHPESGVLRSRRGSPIGTPQSSISPSKIDGKLDSDLTSTQKSRFKKAFGTMFTSRSRQKPEDFAETEIGDVQNLSPVALQYLGRVKDFCSRIRIQPGELYRSHIMVCEASRAPCSSFDSFCKGLLTADSSLNTRDDAILREIYEISKSYCPRHKTACLTRERFVEAVEYGAEYGPARSPRRKSTASPRYSTSPSEAPDSDAMSDASVDSTPRMRSPERPLTVARGRSGTQKRSPGHGDRNARHRGNRRELRGLPGGAPVEPLTDRAESLLAFPDASLFRRLGGDTVSNKMSREAFIKGMQGEARRARKTLPLNTIEATWRKADPTRKGAISFQDFQKTFTKVRPTSASSASGGSIGLSNLGNTCYMNASLQCLRNCRGLTELLLDARFVQTQLNTSGFLGSKGSIATEYCELLRRLQSSKNSYESPVNFKAVVGKKDSEYGGRRQQDAQEFIGFLLDMLHEDLNRVKSKPYVVQADITSEKVKKMGYERCAAEEWYNYLKRDNSVIVDSFQGQLKSMVECQRCKYSVTKFESFMFLSVPTVCQDGTKLTSLAECLAEYSKPEVLSHENQWYCSQCKQHRDAKKAMHIWKVPRYLIVHLKRFHVTRSSHRVRLVKATQDINVPLDMSFARAVHPKSVQKLPPQFRLQSFVQHIGTETSGHYTAYTKRSRGWTLCDDARCTSVEEEEIRKQAADGYVYIFERAHDMRNVKMVRQTPSWPEAWPHVADKDRAWSFITR